jgi:hypothetical protein
MIQTVGSHQCCAETETLSDVSCSTVRETGPSKQNETEKPETKREETQKGADIICMQCKIAFLVRIIFSA